MSAWRWNAVSGVQMLPTLQGNLGSPTGINDRGQIVGYGPSASGGGAFLHENGVTRQLPGDLAIARAISEAGHVVGSTTGSRGAMWSPDGTLSIICTPVQPAVNYTSTCGAWGVNTEGIAVGWKSDKYGQYTKAYKWSLAGF